MRRENDTTYPAWRDTWDANLSPADGELIKAMVDDRNVEVHESGSMAAPRETQRLVGEGHYDLGAAGSVQVVGPPGVFPLATLHGAELRIRIGAAERPVADACRDYLGLLTQMVAAFKAAHP